METIPCPYCEADIRMEDVDNDGGVCPECGMMITGSAMFSSDDDDEDDDDVDDDFDDDFDDDED